MRDEESKNLLNIIKSSGAKYQFADKSVLDKESEGRRHQGFIAYVSDYKYAELGEILAAVENKEDAFLVMLDGVEDPHNLGSVIRVCECAGVDGLIIGKRRSASVTDAVMRISEGSANHLKIARVTNLNSALDEIKKRIYGLTRSNSAAATYIKQTYGQNLHGYRRRRYGRKRTHKEKMRRAYFDTHVRQRQLA